MPGGHEQYVTEPGTSHKTVTYCYYWELITEDWWAGFDDRIWVVSPMLLFDPDNFLGVLGSDRQVDANDQLLQRRFSAQIGDRLIEGKAKRLKNLLIFVNQLQSNGLITGSDASSTMAITVYKIMMIIMFIGIHKQKDGKIRLLFVMVLEI
jgi:hypothetical protein